MGEIHFPLKAKLICGLLAADDSFLNKGKKILKDHFGAVDSESDILPFNFTEYYCDEMGENILRQYISFEQLIEQDTIADIKRTANDLEQQFHQDTKRQVNLDPGYVTLDKMVLATTKPATYRIYLGMGIYAQSTLFFKDGTFHPWEWTYPDYKFNKTISFFNVVRNIYKEQLKTIKK